MGSIIYNNRNIIEFKNNYIDNLIDYFNLSKVEYKLVNENIIIFPALLNKTIILKNKAKNREEKALVEYIKNALINEGATVIFDEDYTNKSYLKYADSQILIVLSFGEKQKNLTAYLPFRPRKISTLIIKQLIKQMTLFDKNITYKIASIWEKLRNTQYWIYLFGNSVPILILEISIYYLSENFFENFRYILLKSIIEELGYIPDSEKVYDVISKIKSYKNKLSDLNKDKQSHIDIRHKSKEKTKAENNSKEIPKILVEKINQNSLKKPISYQITYPGEGLVYEFKRPIPNLGIKSEYTKGHMPELLQNNAKQCHLEEKFEKLSVKVESYKSGLDELKQSYMKVENNLKKDTNVKYSNPQIFYPAIYPQNHIIYPYWYNYCNRYMWYNCYPIIYPHK